MANLLSYNQKMNFPNLGLVGLVTTLLILGQIRFFDGSSVIATCLTNIAPHPTPILNKVNGRLGRRKIFRISAPIRASYKSASDDDGSSHQSAVSSSIKAALSATGSSPRKSFNELADKSSLLPPGAMKSPECYFELIQRLQQWLKKYRELQKMSRMPTKSALQVLHSEQAKVDERLVEEECSKSGSGFFLKTNFNLTDFVYKTLKKLVKQLEETLLKEEKEIEKENEDKGKSNQTATDYMQNITTEQIMEGMEMLKTEIISRAKDELSGATKLAAMNSLASLSNILPGTPSTTVEYIGSIFELILNVGPSHAVNFIRDSQLRSALSTLNQMNPMHFLKCSDNDDQKDDDSNC